jgi:hypothetical protein
MKTALEMGKVTLMDTLTPSFQVLIPYHQRPDLTPVLSSLLAQQLTQSITVIGDPPPVIADCRLGHLPFQIHPFVKAAYLNQGLQHTSPGLILISDADIIWNAETLMAFSHYLQQHPRAIVYVQTVEETVEATPALKRARWQARLCQAEGQNCLSITQEQHLSRLRPGCGLIAAHRQTLLEIGGYKETLQGWGWEDQDLLLRAQLLGYSICCMGSVLHISHGDGLRNQGRQELPTHTRDRNILLSTFAIARGELYGSLASNGALHKPVQIDLPPELLASSDNLSN